MPILQWTTKTFTYLTCKILAPSQFVRDTKSGEIDIPIRQGDSLRRPLSSHPRVIPCGLRRLGEYRSCHMIAVREIRGSSSLTSVVIRRIHGGPYGGTQGALCRWNEDNASVQCGSGLQCQSQLGLPQSLPRPLSLQPGRMQSSQSASCAGPRHAETQTTAQTCSRLSAKSHLN